MVKWKLSSTNEAIVPLASEFGSRIVRDLARLERRNLRLTDSFARCRSSVNCWPSPSNDGCDVNIEFELEAKHLTLRNVVISIPLPQVPSLD